MENNRVQTQNQEYRPFVEKVPLVAPRPAFEEALRERVLQSYTNYYEEKQMKEKGISFFRRFGLIAAGTFALGIVFALGLVSFLDKDEKTSEEEKRMGAEIAYFDGDFEIQNEQGGWSDGVLGSELSEGDTVRVAGIGRAVIHLDDGSAVRINTDSTIALTSLDPEHVIITNVSGDVYTRVVKSERVFEVVADGITYQSMGTAYKTINKDSIKGVEVYESQVKVIGVNADNEVLLQQGERYFLVNVNAPQVEKQVIEVVESDLRKDEFVLWNKEQDNAEFSEELGVLKDVRPADQLSEVKPDSAIILTATTDAGGIILGWDFQNLSNEKGVKIVKSWNPNPTFGIDADVYVSDPNQRSLGLEIRDSKAYYFRVCRFTGNSCDVYSNEVQVTAPEPPAPPAPTDYIYLSGYSPAGGKAQLSWSVSGIDVSKGYKVVWSTSPWPVYPGNEYQYLSGPDETSTKVYIGSGTYYIRVCQYLGGSCGVYSNQIVLSL